MEESTRESCGPDFSQGVDAVVEHLLFNTKGVRESSKAYNRDSWIFTTIFAWHGRAYLGKFFWSIVVECCCVVVVLQYFRDTPVILRTYKWIQPLVNLPPTPLKLMGVGIIFLVVFRTQTSYQRWAEARKIWADTTVVCRDLAMQSASYIEDYDTSNRVCRWLIVYAISVKSWLRDEEVDTETVKPILTHWGLKRLTGAEILEDDQMEAEQAMYEEHDKKLSWHFKHVCMPLACLEVMRETLSQVTTVKAVGPWHMAMEGNIKQLGVCLANFERVMDSNIPFAYVSHLRTLVVIYLYMMPIFLVDNLGWFTLPSVWFVAYVAVGLENVSVEIENPFGHDANDLPMDLFCAHIARDVRDALRRREGYGLHGKKSTHSMKRYKSMHDMNDGKAKHLFESHASQSKFLDIPSDEYMEEVLRTQQPADMDEGFHDIGPTAGIRLANLMSDKAATTAQSVPAEELLAQRPLRSSPE
eukprot:gnl/TRDRNA2_/TRDRNA2_196160_c0_seq1.p1 gnl/TRDRNA2_/TRDRNA2_196160_c0~~gnl/TRDRNA2_/TRDRNA2_196160_c0_seq1.p1  ORF type:complete len:471 (-),score=78.39 gnl/TRDRNA2_/TRDRNA2_196160_c0_seq1:72-1484(-)